MAQPTSSNSPDPQPTMMGIEQNGNIQGLSPQLSQHGPAHYVHDMNPGVGSWQFRVGPQGNVESSPPWSEEWEPHPGYEQAMPVEQAMQEVQGLRQAWHDPNVRKIDELDMGKDQYGILPNNVTGGYTIWRSPVGQSTWTHPIRDFGNGELRRAMLWLWLLDRGGRTP